MNKRLQPFILGALLASCILFSCQKNSSSEEKIVDKTPSTRIGISRKITELTSSDAETIARLYLTDSYGTKSSTKSIRNIVTVTDSTGKAAFYAINFDDGFIWVSATKDYYPILAEVEHGTFTSNDTGTGLDFVRDELAHSVTSPKPDSILTKMRMLWHKYELAEEGETVRTKVNSEYEEELTELKDIAMDNGYKCYPLSKAIENGMSQGVYNAFEDKAIDAYAGGSYDGSDEYDYNTTAYIFEKDYSVNEVINPQVTTHWGQEDPYNSDVPGGKKLGCVTIATAQLMKFYRLPIFYNWDAMPNSGSNDILSAFLADLRGKLKIDDDGGGYIADAVTYLNTLNSKYKFKNITYSNYKLVGSLKQKNIAIMRGYSSNLKAGHAWICDGYTYSEHGIEYQLYVLNPSSRDFDYIKWYTQDVSNGFSEYTFHMNWGWEGQYDGNFKEGYWPSSNYYNFSSDKRIVLKEN